jgi:ankyrin repeat protein
MPRIDRLCDLSADKSTSLADLRKFINVQPININERRPEYNTRAVDFAAQSGNFANFLFLAEEMQANMDVDPQLDVFNALQWAHYPNSSPEVKAYLTDPEKKPWLRFKDGMDGLHIAAYLGQCDVVENLLAENPDRVCELIQNRYTPLYWANLGKQVEMQTLLKHKLAAYAERYAAQDKKMLAYHFGMIMAAFGDHQDYPEFSEFLTLGKKMRAELKWLKVMYDYLRSIIRHGDIAFEQTKEEEKKLYAAAPNDTSVLIFEESLWPRSIRIIEQNLKAILELPETHKPEEMLVSERLSLLELYHRAASINWVLLNEERQKPEYNWDIIKRYLNKAYHYSELGLIISEQLSYSDLQSEDEAFQVELHDKLKSTLTSAEELERELQKENNTLTITYSPIKLFFNLLKRVDTTPQMVTEFLATNSISTTQRYHSRTFIEYAVCYSTTSIARLLIETNREALATAKHEHRLNLLDCLRDNKGISTSTREYILDPDTEIWKAFDDNTTELHVDAYAGRIDKVLKTLAENPDRINEINIFGEGIFFWAFYSDDSANFLAKLQQQSVLCLAPAANNNEWKKILTFFKSLEHFKESCSKKDKILEIYEFYTAWFATLELTDDGEIEEYEQLNDYLYADLTRLRLETDGESEKRFSLARLAAFKIIKPNKKDKLLNNILEAKISFFIR